MILGKVTVSLLAGFALSAFAPTRAARAEVLFEPRFRQAIEDQVLDRREFLELLALSKTELEPEDAFLAQNLLQLLNNYASLVRLSFHYTYAHRQYYASFLFSPTYAEEELIVGVTPAQLLSRISQQDLLAETKGDGFRCGAAALLAAHYLLYGNLNAAFNLLGMPAGPLTYKKMHLAQEALYQLANSDGIPGLNQRVVYQTLPNGEIRVYSNEGEIVIAGQKLGLKIIPLNPLVLDKPKEKSRAILDFWNLHPQASVLLGVYLDPETGQVSQPNQSNKAQNHFVLIFLQNRHIWMYNSGVLNNGLYTASHPLSVQEVEELILQSKGMINLIDRE